MTRLDTRIFKKFPFHPKKKPSTTLSGHFQSRLKGEGYEFYGLRPYELGDDSRKIHWRHYAKTGELFVRETNAESNIRIWVAQDISSSMAFGAKPELMMGFYSFIEHLARNGNNPVGVVWFQDTLRLLRKPRSGYFINRLSKEIAESLKDSKEGKLTNISSACAALAKHARAGDVVFFVSDLLSKENIEEQFRTIVKLDQELIPVVVRDPREEIRVDNIRLSLQDMETGRTLGPVLDTSLDEHDAMLRETFLRLDLDPLWIRGESYDSAIEIIAEWLYLRSKR